MGELLHELGVDPLLLIAQVVNFLILLGLLWKFLYKPLTKALRDRRNTIEKSLKDAAQIEEDLKTSKEQATQIIDTANTQADKLKAQNQLELDKLRQERLKNAEIEATNVYKRAEEAIKEEKFRMEEEVRSSAVNLVGLATEKVLQKSLDKKAHQQLINESIDEVVKNVS